MFAEPAEPLERVAVGNAGGGCKRGAIAAREPQAVEVARPGIGLLEELRHAPEPGKRLLHPCRLVGKTAKLGAERIGRLAEDIRGARGVLDGR